MPRKRKEDMDRDIAEGKIQQPQQRCAANARERSRMRVLSKAFSRLKTTLPWVPPDTKLSKLDTLRLASSYIAHLKQILDHEENNIHSGGTFIHPLNLTWPFTFSSRTFGSSPAPSPHPVTNNKCTNGNNNNNTNNNNNASAQSNINTNRNNNDNNNNTINNNNNRNLYSNSNTTIFAAIDPYTTNNATNNLVATGNQHHLLLNGNCQEGLSPISDTSSINEHEIVSH